MKSYGYTAMFLTGLQLHVSGNDGHQFTTPLLLKKDAIFLSDFYHLSMVSQWIFQKHPGTWSVPWKVFYCTFWIKQSCYWSNIFSQGLTHFYWQVLIKKIKEWKGFFLSVCVWMPTCSSVVSRRDIKVSALSSVLHCWWLVKKRNETVYTGLIEELNCVENF